MDEKISKIRRFKVRTEKRILKLSSNSRKIIFLCLGAVLAYLVQYGYLNRYFFIVLLVVVFLPKKTKR